MTASVERVVLEDDEDLVSAYLLERGYSDGLPVVVPTEERVERMVAGSGRDPAELLGTVPPRFGPASVELVAVNAVIAGCAPEHMPVLLAAVEAVLDPAWKLEAVQPTTMSLTPMVIVNGPVAARAGLHGGIGAMGPGWRANATIGRALRLVIQNVGDAVPGEADRCTQGFVGKYTFAFAENEADSPFEPFHVSRGYDAGDSVVTVVAVNSSINIADSTEDAGELLKTITGTLILPGGINLLDPRNTSVLALNPLHAQILAGAGFDRRRLQEHIVRNCTIDPSAMSGRRRGLRRAEGEELYLVDGRVPFTNDTENVLVVVVGGMTGNHSAWMPNGLYGHAASRRVSEPA